MQEVASENGIAPPLVYVDEVAQAAVSVRVSGISFGAAFSEAAALGLLELQQQAPPDRSQKLLFAALRDLCRVVYGAVFFRLVKDLTSVDFQSREERLTLGECFAMLSTGKLALDEPQGPALIGAALLKQCETAR